MEPSFLSVDQVFEVLINAFQDNLSYNFSSGREWNSNLNESANSYETRFLALLVGQMIQITPFKFLFSIPCDHFMRVKILAMKLESEIFFWFKRNYTHGDICTNVWLVR